jgi:Na+/H+ antiporter NhaC
MDVRPTAALIVLPALKGGGNLGIPGAGVNDRLRACHGGLRIPILDALSAPRPPETSYDMRLFTLAALIALAAVPSSIAGQEVSSPPEVVLIGVPFQVTVRGGTDPSVWYEVRTADGGVLAGGTVEAYDSATVTGLVVRARNQLPLTVLIGDRVEQIDPTLTPGWFSLLPPLVAIALALLFREVVTALFAGVWLGALAVAGFNPITATWRLIDQFVVPAVADTGDGHTQIVVFSLLLGGMVGVIARNGGTFGIVEAVAPFARTARRGKLATWLAGMAIFFDDYANTLIVGNTMRPITDRLKISREKLAYLVDSTAAPVAALVPISTWVGYEISLIGSGMRIAADQNPAGAEALLAQNPFSIFIQTIPYLFYPLLALVLVFLTSVMDRDFGPMAQAERRAAKGGGLHRPGAMLAADTSSKLMQPKAGIAYRWWNAGVPVLTVIGVVLVGLYATGSASVGPDAALMDVFGAADPFSTLLWGSLAGCIVAVGLSLAQKSLAIEECVDALVGGMRAMMIAMIILTLAWSLGDVTEAVGTAQFLSLLLSERIAVQLIPVIVFATSAAMAFATGTSWGTMAILLPVVIPLTVALGGPDVYPGAPSGSILLGATASVLAGAIFGDHCSPISDTTVLSSTASACDHVDHVRTQLPYALVVALIGMVLGNVGTAYGLPAWLALIAGAAVLYVLLRTRGTTVGEAAQTATAD